MDSAIWSNIPIDIYHIIRDFLPPRIIECALNIFKKINIKLNLFVEPSILIDDGKIQTWWYHIDYELEQTIYKTRNMRLIFESKYGLNYRVEIDITIKNKVIINIHHRCYVTGLGTSFNFNELKKWIVEVRLAEIYKRYGI
jgi:hypothetical protein